MIFNYITKIFIGETFEWNVSIKPDQVLKELGAKNQGSFFERMFSPGISVRARGNKFSFSKMSIGNLPMSGNAYTHVLVGRVVETPIGSKVSAFFRLPIHVFIFSTFWLSGAMLGGFVGGVLGLIKSKQTGNYEQLPLIMFFFLFPISGIFMLNLFRSMAQKNEKEIIQIINDCLEQYKAI